MAHENLDRSAARHVEGQRPAIIGLSGTIGSGKSYAAAHLDKQFNFRIHKFAKPLKDMLRALGLPEDRIEGPLRKEPFDMLCGQTPRHAMQTLGTEWGRNMIGADFWVNAWRATRPSGAIVADDVRFPNEAAEIRRLGGIVVRIFTVEDALNEDEMHASEMLDFEPDVHLFNRKDGSFLPSIEHIVHSFGLA